MQADHCGIGYAQLIFEIAPGRRDHEHVRDAAAIELVAGGDRDVVEFAAFDCGRANACALVS
jgi:hypothetical protein